MRTHSKELVKSLYLDELCANRKLSKKELISPFKRFKQRDLKIFNL